MEAVTAMHVNPYPLAALAAQAHTETGPSLGQGVMIVLVVTILSVTAFLIVHLFITTLLLGRSYEFPIKIGRLGANYCPHCGKEMNRRA